jgi:CRISPR-associated protein Csx16
MTTWFISRHPGAVQWAQRQNLHIDRYVVHLNPTQIEAGDTVIGSLPVNLAAKVCSRGARYLHLSLELPAHLRGRELSSDQLNELGARVQEYRVERAPVDPPDCDAERGHDRWFKEHVQASLDDPRPCMAHDQVMAEIDQIITHAEQRQPPKPT